MSDRLSRTSSIYRARRSRDNTASWTKMQGLEAERRTQSRLLLEQSVVNVLVFV